MTPRRFALSLLLPLALAAGCQQSLTCGAGTVQKTDDQGNQSCVAPSASGIACDSPDGGTARLVGGVCMGDPGSFPTCGGGTHLDKASNLCLPDKNADACMAPPCLPADMAMGFCVNGVVRYLKDESCTAPKVFEVRAYDPFAFLNNPNVMPEQVVMTDANGGYKLTNLVDMTGQALVAIAVIDPAADPKNHMFILSGSGAQSVMNGKSYRVDLYAIELGLVAMWDAQAGLNGPESFEAVGGYLARFYSAADEKMLVPGVQLTLGAKPAPKTFYFKGNLSTIDKSLMATDAIGTAIQRVAMPGDLQNYSGMGGGNTWQIAPGASAAGVIFVQRFHPAM